MIYRKVTQSQRINNVSRGKCVGFLRQAKVRDSDPVVVPGLDPQSAGAPIKECGTHGGRVLTPKEILKGVMLMIR